jgi:hypothetical protein
MSDSANKLEKQSASAALGGEHAAADGRPETGSVLGRSPGASLAVLWMWLVLFGFVVIRVIGSQSFRALHWFGRAQ